MFGILAATDLILISSELFKYRYFTKPFLMPLLLIAIFAHIGFKRYKVLKLLIAGALLAGTTGDILLMQSDEKLNVFAYGLASFLVMQVLYFIYFIRVQSFKKDNLISSIILATILFSFSFFFVKFLNPFLGELKIPVIIYAIIISAMLLSAVNLYFSHRVYKLALRFFIPGALLLIISDSLLAINKFYFKDNLMEVLVMGLYVGGQLLLALGFIKHLKRHRKSRLNDEAHEEELLKFD